MAGVDQKWLDDLESRIGSSSAKIIRQDYSAAGSPASQDRTIATFLKKLDEMAQKDPDSGTATVQKKFFEELKKSNVAEAYTKSFRDAAGKGGDLGKSIVSALENNPGVTPDQVEKNWGNMRGNPAAVIPFSKDPENWQSRRKQDAPAVPQEKAATEAPRAADIQQQTKDTPVAPPAPAERGIVENGFGWIADKVSSGSAAATDYRLAKEFGADYERFASTLKAKPELRTALDKLSGDPTAGDDAKSLLSIEKRAHDANDTQYFKKFNEILAAPGAEKALIELSKKGNGFSDKNSGDNIQTMHEILQIEPRFFEKHAAEIQNMGDKNGLTLLQVKEGLQKEAFLKDESKVKGYSEFKNQIQNGGPMQDLVAAVSGAAPGVAMTPAQQLTLLDKAHAMAANDKDIFVKMDELSRKPGFNEFIAKVANDPAYKGAMKASNPESEGVVAGRIINTLYEAGKGKENYYQKLNANYERVEEFKHENPTLGKMMAANVNGGVLEKSLKELETVDRALDARERLVKIPGYQEMETTMLVKGRAMDVMMGGANGTVADKLERLEKVAAKDPQVFENVNALSKGVGFDKFLNKVAGNPAAGDDLSQAMNDPDKAAKLTKILADQLKKDPEMFNKINNALTFSSKAGTGMVDKLIANPEKTFKELDEKQGLFSMVNSFKEMIYNFSPGLARFLGPIIDFIAPFLGMLGLDKLMGGGDKKGESDAKKDNNAEKPKPGEDNKPAPNAPAPKVQGQGPTAPAVTAGNAPSAPGAAPGSTVAATSSPSTLSASAVKADDSQEKVIKREVNVEDVEEPAPITNTVLAKADQQGNEYVSVLDIRKQYSADSSQTGMTRSGLVSPVGSLVDKFAASALGKSPDVVPVSVENNIKNNIERPSVVIGKTMSVEL